MAQFDNYEETEQNGFDIESIFAREMIQSETVEQEPAVKYDIDSILSDNVSVSEEIDSVETRKFDVDSLLDAGADVIAEEENTAREKYNIDLILRDVTDVSEEIDSGNTVQYDIDDVLGGVGERKPEEHENSADAGDAVSEAVSEFEEELFKEVKADRVSEKVELTEEDLKKAEEEKEKRREIKKQYEAAYDAWYEECEKIKESRNEKISKILLIEKDQLSRNYKDRYDELFKQNFALIKEQTKRKADAEELLPTLGVFQGAEKKAQFAIIEESTKSILDAQDAITRAETEYKDSFIVVDSMLRSKEAEIRKQVEGGLPYPPEPVKPAFLDVEDDDDYLPKNDRCKTRILRYIADGDRYSLKEIVFGVSGAHITEEDVINVIGELVEEGKMKQEELQHVVYYMKK